MELMPDIFPGISLSVEAAADIVLFLFAAAAAVLSAVLFFHWRKYGMGGSILAKMEMIYISGAVVLLGAAFFALYHINQIENDFF